MQPYYAIKLKCFLVQVCAAGTLMITAICVFASALQEYLNGYRASARLAYPSSFIICGALFACGLFILYEAFHFEKRVFGKKTNDFETLKQDMAGDGFVATENLIVTDHFVFMFLRRLPKMCSLIRMTDIVACFELPVYGTVESPSEYRLMVYDRHFKEHVIVLDASMMETGHQAKEKICSCLPWIYQDDREYFLDLKMTKNGKKTILDRVDRHAEDLEEQAAAARKREMMEAAAASKQAENEASEEKTGKDALGLKDMLQGISSRKNKKQ